MSWISIQENSFSDSGEQPAAEGYTMDNLQEESIELEALLLSCGSELDERENPVDTQSFTVDKVMVRLEELDKIVVALDDLRVKEFCPTEVLNAYNIAYPILVKELQKLTLADDSVISPVATVAWFKLCANQHEWVKGTEGLDLLLSNATQSIRDDGSLNAKRKSRLRAIPVERPEDHSIFLQRIRDEVSSNVELRTKLAETESPSSVSGKRGFAQACTSSSDFVVYDVDAFYRATEEPELACSCDSAPCGISRQVDVSESNFHRTHRLLRLAVGATIHNKSAFAKLGNFCLETGSICSSLEGEIFCRLKDGVLREGVGSLSYAELSLLSARPLWVSELQCLLSEPDANSGKSAERRWGKDSKNPYLPFARAECARVLPGCSDRGISNNSEMVDAVCVNVFGIAADELPPFNRFFAAIAEAAAEFALANSATCSVSSSLKETVPLNGPSAPEVSKTARPVSTESGFVASSTNQG